jgi:SAM-dependent methyltransferase
VSRPDAAESGQAVARHYSGEAGRHYYEWQKGLGRVGAELTVPFFAHFVGPAHRVVDSGCGGGFLLDLLPAADRAGIEPNAAARAEGAGRGLRIEESAAAFPESWADVIISNHALEHMLRPFDELCALRRLLRPGGVLVIMLPIDDWRRQRRADVSDINHHLYTWTPLLLTNLLDEAGFTDVTVEVITHAWPPYPLQLRRVVGHRAFGAAARLWSMMRRQRQMRAVARRPSG